MSPRVPQKDQALEFGHLITTNEEVTVPAPGCQTRSHLSCFVIKCNEGVLKFGFLPPCQITCVVSRMSESAASLRTVVTSLIGRDRIT